jgi:hypothetical protein
MRSPNFPLIFRSEKQPEKRQIFRFPPRLRSSAETEKHLPVGKETKNGGFPPLQIKRV